MVPAGVLLALTASACGDDGGSSSPDAGLAPDASAVDAAPIDAMPGAQARYEFESRFVAGQSALSYDGQVMRQVLISELTSYIGRLTESIGTTPPEEGDVLDELLFYYDFDSSTSGQASLTLQTDPPLAQATFDEVSTNKQLRDKTAGNDASTDHKEWNVAGNFQGWSEGGEDADTPTKLIEYWFGLLDDLAFERGQGNAPQDPDGVNIGKVYITERGQDLQQLIQKFLTVSVAFSQGADDYLDDDVDGKGLLSSNAQSGDSPYSVLGHAWDEAFGYFGAARDYDAYTDDELSGAGGRDEYQSYHDSDGDQKIDLLREYNFGIAVNCAKRDRGSVEATDFTQDAFDAFVTGRQLILDAGDELDADELEQLKAQRDIAVDTWEKCIAATVAHYINETLADMDKFGTEEYSFESHAKHWSELKGFSLGLQFNPRSPMLEDTRFVDFHGYIGDAPVLPNDAGGDAAIDQYKADLQAARDIIQEAYGFSEANVQGW